MQPGHPAEILIRVSALVGRPCDFEFSKYVYVPQSTKDERELVRLPADRALAAVPALLESLNERQELALHSRVSASGVVLHIPMLDLIGPFCPAMVDPLRSLMGEFSVPEFWVYDTGRSAHVYGLGLLPDERLVKFFARSLLLNLPGREPIVDARWIGHRIYAECGSLRWSCNTKQYLQGPVKSGSFRT